MVKIPALAPKKATEEADGGRKEEAPARMDADAEKAAEEDDDSDAGDTFEEEASGGGSPRTARPQKESSLSVISKKYDLDGKGSLDETEQIMRAYDENNDGRLDMREVYKIVQELREQQRELNNERKKILDMRRAIIFLCVFTLVLTLAMLGVSFVAARLAKDVSVTVSHALADKYSGESLSTVGAARTFDFQYSEEDAGDDEEGSGGRRLFDFFHPRVGEEIRRRMNEVREEKKEEEKQGRKLFGGRLSANRLRGDSNCGRDSDSDSDEDCDEEFSTRNSFAERSGCNNLQGFVDRSTYTKMQYGIRSSEQNLVVQYYDDDFLFTKKISVNTAADTPYATFIESDLEQECDDYGGNCDLSQRLYVLEPDCLGSRNSRGRSSGSSGNSQDVCFFSCSATTRGASDSDESGGDWNNP